MKIIRDNVEKTVRITLETFPDDAVASNDAVKGGIATGISVEAIDSATAKRMNITGDKGVVVSKVEPNSAAAKAGLRIGFVILSIDNTEVNSPKEFGTVLEAAKAKMDKENRKTLRMYVQDTTKQPSFVILRFD